MHQDAANRMQSWTAGFVPLRDVFPRDANGLGPFSLKRELRRVMKNQNPAIARGKAVAGRLEMARQYVCFVHAAIREKAIRRLGVCPILARHGYALANRVTDLLKQI